MNNISPMPIKIANYLYPIVSFISAFLMFILQPMFAKLLTPLMGGSPMVWNTALVFYQFALLLGYLYAHLITKLFTIKVQLIIHSILLILAVFVQPIHVTELIGAPNIKSPIIWTLLALLISIGLPIIAISATAPLIGAWRARFGEEFNPYYLYAASNFGSFLALGLYPFVFEPFMGTKIQSYFWMFGFVLFIGLIIYAGFLSKNLNQLKISNNIGKIDWPLRLKWLFYSAIPSALLVALTNHIVTDIASVPLLWLPPLALYLLTFVIAFSSYGKKITEGAGILKLFIVFLLAFLMGIEADKGLLGILIHLMCFFLIVLCIHLELAGLSPNKDKLTEYYLFLSTGGVIGGIFATLFAPIIFKTTIEYPVLLASSLLIGSFGLKHIRNSIGPIFICFFIAMWFSNRNDIASFLNASILNNSDKINIDFDKIMLVWENDIAAGIMVIFLFLGAILGRKSSIFVFCAGFIAFILPLIYENSNENIKYRGRNFFGVLQIEDTGKSPDGWRILSNGTTLHGVMSLDEKRNKTAMSYYWYETPIGILFDEASNKKPNDLNAGIIGLGMGSTACYARPNQNWTFFEINPLVVDLALNEKLTGFIPRCASQAKIILGDARIEIKNQKDNNFDILLLDAFSSDSIPTHLITSEAISLLMSKVKKDGILIVHISNRYLELSNIVADGAFANGFSVISGNRYGNDDNPYADTGVSAMVIAHSPQRLENYRDEIWTKYEKRSNSKPWTDDHTDILRAILDRNK